MNKAASTTVRYRAGNQTTPQKRHSWVKIVLIAVASLAGLALVGVVVGVVSVVLAFNSMATKSEAVASYVHDQYVSFIPPLGWTLQDTQKNADAIDIGLDDTGWNYTYTVPSVSARVLFKQYETALDSSIPGFAYKIMPASADGFTPETLRATNTVKNLNISAGVSVSGKGNFVAEVRELHI